MGNGPTGKLHIVCAHFREARPLIDSWRLAATETKPFRVFENKTTALIVTGCGNALAAAGAATLFARDPTPSAWLNFGVAGHPTLSIGTACLGNKIVDRASGQTFYPSSIYKTGFLSLTVETVRQVETEYPAPVAYDMEAAGIAQVCGRFGPMECFQTVKVISDNASTPFSETTTDSAATDLTAALPELDLLVAQMRKVASSLEVRSSPPEGYESLLRSHRFTVTQSHQLRHLLRQWSALTTDQPPVSEFETMPLKSALQSLREKVTERASAYEVPQ